MLQILVASLDKDVRELTHKMNMGSDAVIVNQCDRNGEYEFTYGEHRIKVIERDERGVGRSRNLALANADAEYIMFSDSDVVYDDGYADKLIKEFEAHPEADLIFFNMRVREDRRTYWNDEFKKVGKTNFGRYGAISIAARREAIIRSGVEYSLLFGGGARFSNGEDSLFIMDLLKKGIAMYASPVCLGEEADEGSTWFKGYTEKFFVDRGVLFYFLYGPMATLWAVRFALTKKEYFKGEIGAFKGYKLIRSGIKLGRKVKKEDK